MAPNGWVTCLDFPFEEAYLNTTSSSESKGIRICWNPQPHLQGPNALHLFLGVSSLFLSGTLVFVHPFGYSCKRMIGKQTNIIHRLENQHRTWNKHHFEQFGRHIFQISSLGFHCIPIWSIYGIFTTTSNKSEPNVGKYTSPMDLMGFKHDIGPTLLSHFHLSWSQRRTFRG